MSTDRHPSIPEGFEVPADPGKVVLEVGEQMIGEIIEYKPDNIFDNRPAPVMELIDMEDNKPKTFWINAYTASKVSYCTPQIGDRLFVLRCPDGKASKPGWSAPKQYEVAIQKRRGEGTDFPPE